MKRNQSIFSIAIFLFIYSISVSAGTIKIRLVEAANAQQAMVSPGLQDVAGTLKKNLRFNSFKLLGSSTVSLPAKSPVPIGGYQLLLTGTSANLSVKVMKNNKTIFQSKVRLIRNSPVIIGGFRGSNGKIIFIFNS